MRIEKIEAVHGRKHAFDVFFYHDIKIRCFLKNIEDFGIRPGLELSEEDFERLKNAVALSKTRQRAATLLSARPMSAGELEKRLVQKGESEENAAEAVKWLTEIHALDDLDYARTVAQHYSRKGYGKAKIKDELYKRFVAREYWDEAFEHMEDTHEAAEKYLKTKLRNKNPDSAEIRKAANALYRRGFSWDEIKEALRRYEEETEE